MNKLQLPQWVWWNKGECELEVLGAGHFPTSIIARTPNDTKIEVDISELENKSGR